MMTCGVFTLLSARTTTQQHVSLRIRSRFSS